MEQAELYGGDPARVVVTGWSRGAIATGALGLYDDATSALFKAFVPYSHLDADCGWVDMKQPALGQRWDRLAGRPTLYLGECAVATKSGPEWLEKIGQNGTHATSGMEFMTTGFANHNDACASNAPIPVFSLQLAELSSRRPSGAQGCCATPRRANTCGTGW